MSIRANNFPTAGIDLRRRQFVHGLAAGSALAGLGLSSTSSFASGPQHDLQTLRGNRFDLSIGHQLINLTGKAVAATTVNESLPAPILRWKEGETVTIRVRNHLPESSSIHWHGIILPTDMDGVPDIAFDGIEPGQSFNYRFKVQQSGTYWYHSHSGFQEQTGLYGPIIIDPIEPEPFSYDRDYVVMLSDWSEESPIDIYAKLKKSGGYYNFNERTGSDLWREISEKGISRTWNDRKMWNQMRMSQRDLADVSGYTYTYLMNGHTPASNWTCLFKPGEKVRLRLINGAAMSFFDLRIPGLKMTVVAADGQNIEPVSVDEIRIGVAETYDVIVTPDGDRAYTLFAQSSDRSGYARGTLTPNRALQSDVPALDPVPNLTMMDMGMAHSMTGTMSGMIDSGGEAPMRKSSMNMSNGSMSTSQMKMAKHEGMPMMGASTQSSMDMGTMQSSKMKGTNINPPVIHKSTEYGPQVDMRSSSPMYRLDDPGVGLRNNGRRVLTYADLKSLDPTPDQRDPDRELELHLTGNMERYMWSVDGIKYADAEPLKFRYGERLRITFVNDTMMSHPMHLHGMWSDLETGGSQRIARKHTVVVQPGARISYRVDVDARGSWAFHCHLLYHMLGMFRRVDVV